MERVWITNGSTTITRASSSPIWSGLFWDHRAAKRHGMWRGKEELNWQHEQVKLDARNPTLDAQSGSDLSIVESHDELVDQYL